MDENYLKNTIMECISFEKHMDAKYGFHYATFNEIMLFEKECKTPLAKIDYDLESVYTAQTSYTTQTTTGDKLDMFIQELCNGQIDYGRSDIKGVKEFINNKVSYKISELIKIYDTYLKNKKPTNVRFFTSNIANYTKTRDIPFSNNTITLTRNINII